ncbi:Alpha/beta hydrolase [uncultured virus]|nr:Alpha/beta hydrolase [uncultured virus]
MDIQLDKITQQYVDSITNSCVPPDYRLPVEISRELFEVNQSLPIRKEKAQIEDLMIGEDLPITTKSCLVNEVSVRLPIRIVRPNKYDGKQPLPITVYLHGGGWIRGSVNTHDRLIRQIANGTFSAVIFVTYTLSPEATFPTAIDECYFATKYFIKNADKYNLDPTRVSIMGDSAGGNLVVPVVMKIKNRNITKLSYLVLFYPVTGYYFNTKSFRQFANLPPSTEASERYHWSLYVPDKAQREDPRASPLNYSIKELSGLPSTLIIMAENDTLRDGAVMFANKLMCAGVETTAVRYLGTIHGFVVTNALSETPAAKSAILLANTTLYETYWKRC